MPEHESTYTQSFNFDILGNMTSKTSTETVYPEKTIGDALNSSIDFSYAEGFAHRLDHAGDRYYSYDDDGNVVRERNEAMPDSSGTDTGSDDDEWDDWDDDWGEGLGESGFGFGMGGSSTGSGGNVGGNGGQSTVYERIYTWDECDRLTGTTEGTTVVGYVYGEDGKRTNKYSSAGETIYFSDLWSWHDSGSIGTGGQTTKNIYLGTERVVIKLNRGDGLDTYSEEYHKTYYWHSDHLGSAHFITDYQGNEYQRIEYTPYGEEWVELKSDSGDQYLPYKFTGKERDQETGLYYYGARYLDPVYSRWLSTDPAMGDYIPTAGAENSNLPGMGGVFNTVNFCLYTYAINNPIMYTDPDGEKVINNSNEYVLIKTEDAGFVILPPKSIYTGKNVMNYDYKGNNVSEIDMGKIDGVIKSNGIILKVSDSQKSPLKGLLPDVSVKVDKDSIMSIHGTISKKVNKTGNNNKKAEGRTDMSGHYNVGDGTEVGDWVPRKPSQDKMKELSQGKQYFLTAEQVINILEDEK